MSSPYQPLYLPQNSSYNIIHPAFPPILILPWTSNSKSYYIYSLVFAEIALGSIPTLYFKLMCVHVCIYKRVCVVSYFFPASVLWTLYVLYSYSLIAHFQINELV